MKKTTRIIALIAIAIMATSCAPQQMVLKGNYAEKPFEVTINKPIEVVWSNIIDFFATKGISIKIIDKSSGLVVSEKTSFANNYTIENEDGSLKNPSAYIVVAPWKYYGATFGPQELSAEWNIRIKSLPDNKTSVNVNLTNVQGSYSRSGTQNSEPLYFTYSGKSTGKFEILIVNELSK